MLTCVPFCPCLICLDPRSVRAAGQHADAVDVPGHPRLRQRCAHAHHRAAGRNPIGAARARGRSNCACRCLPVVSLELWLFCGPCALHAVVLVVNRRPCTCALARVVPFSLIALRVRPTCSPRFRVLVLVIRRFPRRACRCSGWSASCAWTICRPSRLPTANKVLYLPGVPLLQNAHNRTSCPIWGCGVCTAEEDAAADATLQADKAKGKPKPSAAAASKQREEAAIEMAPLVCALCSFAFAVVCLRCAICWP